jgi:lysophospholipase L1-like esterase
MGDVSERQRASINPEIRIAILGDSTRANFGLQYWYGRFGVGGKICTPADVVDGFLALAGGVTGTADNALYSTTWTGCDYFNVPIAGTITYNDNRYQCNRFELWYFAEDATATGVIEYEIDGSGTWVSVFQNSSVNVDNNLAGLTLTKVTGIIEDSGGLGHTRNYKLRYRGLTGTAKIVALGGYLSGGGVRPSGVTTMDMGKGGQFIEWTSDVPAANFASALTGFAPHVVFFRMWEDHFGADYQTDFATVITRIKSALPTASIVVTGRHPTSDITSNFEVTAKEAWLRNYCKTNDLTFLPVTKSFPPYAEMQVGAARPLLVDAVHLSNTGRAYLDEVIRDHIPFLSSALPIWWIGPIGQQPTESYLQGVRGCISKEFSVGGFSQKDFAFMGMSCGSGNNAANVFTPSTGTGRLKDVAGYLHNGRLGLYNDGYLTGVIGSGRFWVGPGGTSAATPGRESGPAKNINGGIVTQNPTTTTPSIRAGVIAGTTAATYAISVDIGASVSSDGTSTAGFFADGRAKIIIPTYADDAAADADSALLSGQLYRTTAGARSVFQKP